MCLVSCIYLILISQNESGKRLDDSTTTTTTTTITTTTLSELCDYKPDTEDFILNYQPNVLLGTKTYVGRVEPTVERIRVLLEIIRSKEAKYQLLLNNFDVFDMIKPMISLKPYTDESNIDEIKNLYHRFIKLMPDQKSINIDPKFIEYLQITSSYLSDGLRNKRTRQVIKLNRKQIILISFFLKISFK
jgi:hypothetical protein